jgi:hypothetical protein
VPIEDMPMVESLSRALDFVFRRYAAFLSSLL